MLPQPEVISFGVDPSTSCTGLVILRGSVDMNPVLVMERRLKPKGKGPWTWDFVNQVASEILDAITIFHVGITVIEGYGLNLRHGSAVIPLISLGATIRNTLQLSGRHWLDPVPSQVKEFVTGNGNANKPAMIAAVQQHWGHKAADDNTADAYACAALGLSFSNALPNALPSHTKICGLLAMQPCN